MKHKYSAILYSSLFCTVKKTLLFSIHFGFPPYEKLIKTLSRKKRQLDHNLLNVLVCSNAKYFHSLCI